MPMTKDEVWTALVKYGIEKPDADNFRLGPWVFEDERRVHITGRSKLAGCEIALTTEKIPFVRMDDMIVVK
jgi:hypothetical protein